MKAVVYYNRLMHENYCISLVCMHVHAKGSSCQEPRTQSIAILSTQELCNQYHRVKYINA